MTKPFFRIEMLPAKHGDALWVEYGKGDDTYRLLIDGGPIHAYPDLRARLEELPDGDRRIELLVITHVDTDHIEGIIRLLAEPRGRWPIDPQDIWFNGWRHMNEARDLGGREGEFLSALIRRRAFDEWNRAFGRKAVVVDPSQDQLPTHSLDGGMTLTLLSPDVAKLKAMADKWEADVDKWAIEPGDLDQAWDQLVEETRFLPEEGLLGPEDFTAQLKAQLKTDPSKANGSSIAFLAEYADRRCLFLADAHMSTVCDSLEKLIPEQERPLKVDAIKLSHHGSRNNLKPRLFELVDAEHFLVSTNGDQHEHPDKAAIESVIVGATRRPTIWFNYRSPYTECWEAGAGTKYKVRYPKAGTEGIVVPIR